jgi:hypothetical protein
LAGGKRARLAQARAALVAPLPPSKRTCTKQAAAAVGSTRELVERVLGLLAGGSRGARGDVGRAASVCRLWRDVAYGEEMWGQMAAEVLPVLEGRRDCRRYVAEQGRCLLERRVWGANEWWEGLRLHLEVWDARDNLRILSGGGRLTVGVSYNAILRRFPLRITGSDRREVVGPAFSAASRDPEHHRFESLKDYFSRAHEPEFLSAVCMRAVVSDARTGRQALLWESGKETQLWAGPLYEAVVIPGGLPNDSFAFGITNGEGLLSPDWGNHPWVGVEVGFFLRPEAGQEGVAEQDRLYRAAGGDVERYGDHDSHCLVALRGGQALEKRMVGQYIRSLLAD